MLLHKNKKTEKEPGLLYFKDKVGSSEHTFRQSDVAKIHNYILRQHNVLDRIKHRYTFKNKMFEPAAIVLQSIKTVINFHTAYLVGNPVTITGTPDAVEIMNKYYRKGTYSKVDWQILVDLLTYGNAFEYVYLDKNKKIKSKVFRNQDSYPIYDDNMEYKYFVEYWKSNQNKDEHFVIYFPDHIDTYINGVLKESKANLSGLPIHYVAMDKSRFDQFGDSIVNDLIPIQDKVEALLSKLDDAITTLSLNPIGVLKGGVLTENDMIDTNYAGQVLNLKEESEFNWENAVMDYNCIKFELDQLYQQFNMIACVPSGVLGSNNISNVSENSMSMIYQLTENKGKQNINALIDGFKCRWEYMRKLMILNRDEISDKDFDSLNVAFNINKPIDTKNNMENIERQFKMGAISRRTVIETSPYTTDSAQELQRLSDEGKTIIGNDSIITNNEE